MINRRIALAGLLGAIALPVRAQPLAYRITPEKIAEGLWVVRGVDAPIAMANGGAIANITILATEAGTVLVDCGPSLRYGNALRHAAEALTGKPVVRLYLTHLHPDHIYAAAAFAPGIVAATPQLATLLKSEGAGFSDGMYRLLGDWMRGTEFTLPGTILAADHETFGTRRLRLLPLAGHSPADLAILDEASGTLIAGDLVFHDRAPSTPHADLAKWHTALKTLAALGHKCVVPGHGPIDPTPTAAIDQTRDWLDWVTATLRAAVAAGEDNVAAGNVAIPARFATLQSARYELQRSVSHFYPGLEAELMPRIDAKR
ncbi:MULTISPECIES: quinoprotein relay system zinc metallohydrolase 1 [Sphingomonas]|jgi:quinoprotein relay system zinc metallohydrolase 1|uniref:Quinoprotein relay system zinc metallohydrolase 1 n=1 Tax=Sphingomonas echinoides TaxID=59803 RepID=A0ABU4PRP8_9SPHN|nr:MULTISPECIES: quinoprotein relay system zinc metallohydrolase 1 [Sphingomonas]MDR6850419.1 quinoprotein relay system zinc metallohydrolase 1 [Sphingomonas sp. BE137]MDX5986320.1 quinoprotein relay system zinc metallohydrolase 1 [Sphingomonas echinoides]